MPFTTEDFFAVFAAYNEAVWPLQIIAYGAGLLAVVLLFRPSRGATITIMTLLASLWAVNGLGYHLTWFAPVNPAARIFAGAFVLQALLLAAAPLAVPVLRFDLRANARSALGLSLMAYAMVIYPLVGMLAGHAWPAVPMFGIAPCPTTIFTIGMLLLAPWRLARWLFVIPLLWALVGGTAAVLLSVPQDYGLIAAALVVAGMGIGRFRRTDGTLHETS